MKKTHCNQNCYIYQPTDDVMYTNDFDLFIGDVIKNYQTGIFYKIVKKSDRLLYTCTYTLKRCKIQKRKRFISTTYIGWPDPEFNIKDWDRLAKEKEKCQK